jgi:hypothetical protein
MTDPPSPRDLHPYIVGDFECGVLCFAHTAREAKRRFWSVCCDDFLVARVRRADDAYCKYMEPGVTEPHEATHHADPMCSRCGQWLCDGDCDDDD